MKKVFYPLFILSVLLSSLDLSAQNPGDSNMIVLGCTDTLALNYDPNATFDDGSCIYTWDSTGTGLIYGCTDPLAMNYDPLATVDDGSCLYWDDTLQFFGCTDTMALNWDPSALYDDGSCIYDDDSTVVGLIYGCTDPLALNYNPAANVDDGSCIYNWDSTVFGCTDTMALNWDPWATVDDGSCIYDTTVFIIPGCTDPLALNYNPFATVNDGSCIYDSSGVDIYGCMDPMAVNYNPFATIDNGSCIYQMDSLCEASFYISDVNDDLGMITIVNTSTEGPFTYYYWDFGDGNFGYEQFPTHVYEEDGFYNVCLTVIDSSDFLGCVSTYCDTIGISLMMLKSNGFTLNVIPESAVSVNEVKEISDLLIYPNPAQYLLTLEFESLRNETLEAVIYDLSGRSVKQWRIAANSGFNREEIDISELPVGSYQIELRNTNTRNFLRFQV